MKSILIKTFISVVALSGSMLSLSHAAEVRVLNWKGYGTDAQWAVEAFEKATGNKVVHDYFNSEQEMVVNTAVPFNFEGLLQAYFDPVTQSDCFSIIDPICQTILPAFGPEEIL